MIIPFVTIINVNYHQKDNKISVVINCRILVGLVLVCIDTNISIYKE